MLLAILSPGISFAVVYPVSQFGISGLWVIVSPVLGSQDGVIQKPPEFAGIVFSVEVVGLGFLFLFFHSLFVVSIHLKRLVKLPGLFTPIHETYESHIKRISIAHVLDLH